MTRQNILRILISSAAVLAVQGCGDDAFSSGCAELCPSPSFQGGLEFELACEALCDAVSACPRLHSTVDCVDRCVTFYVPAADSSAECGAARIDLVNCYSALRCSVTPPDVERQCTDAATYARAECGSVSNETGATVTRSEPGRELEIRDSAAEDDGGVEPAELVDESADAEPGPTDLFAPIVVTTIPGVAEMVELESIEASAGD